MGPRKRYSSNQRRELASKRKTSGNISRKDESHFHISVVQKDGSVCNPQQLNSSIQNNNAKGAAKVMKIKPRLLTAKMVASLKKYGVMPSDHLSARYDIFPPLHRIIRSGYSHKTYEAIMNSFFSFCIDTDQDLSAIALCDNIPNRGGWMPVPTIKSLMTYCLHRRGSKGSILKYNDKVLYSYSTKKPKECLGSWNAFNEEPFCSIIGSALAARGVDTESFQRQCDECSALQPTCPHSNCQFRFSSGYARYSPEFSIFYDEIKDSLKDRQSKATLPCTPFQLVKLSKACWYSKDFLKIYIFSIFLRMVFSFSRSNVTFTTIFEDIITSLGNSFQKGVALDRISSVLVCKNREQVFSFYSNFTKLGEWICPNAHFFFISACTGIREGYIFPSLKAMEKWISNGFVGKPDNTVPMSYTDFSLKLKDMFKTILDIEDCKCCINIMFIEIFLRILPFIFI